MKILLVSSLILASFVCLAESLNEFLAAVEKNDLPKIRTMVESDPAFLGKERECGTYPLFEAVERQKSDIVKYFIEKGAPLDVKNTRNGDNVILYMARSYRVDFATAARVKVFIENLDFLAGLKASFSAVDKEGRGPLLVLAGNNKLLLEDAKPYMEIVNAYIKNGAKFTDKGNACTLHALLSSNGMAKDGKTYEFGAFEAAKEFVTLGAGVNDVDTDKNTPLHMLLLNKRASDDKKADTLKFLLEKGAKTNVKNKAGQEPEDLVKKGSQLYEILKKTKPKK